MANAPPMDTEHPQEELLEDIRTVLWLTLAELNVIIGERGQSDFQYIAEMALRTLGEEDRPGQVLLAEDQRLEHILMDESSRTPATHNSSCCDA